MNAAYLQHSLHLRGEGEVGRSLGCADLPLLVHPGVGPDIQQRADTLQPTIKPRLLSSVTCMSMSSATWFGV